VPRIHLRKHGAQVWTAEAATHTGWWEPMPLRGLEITGLWPVAAMTWIRANQLNLQPPGDESLSLAMIAHDRGEATGASKSRESV
jgi:hypothetical protein